MGFSSKELDLEDTSRTKICVLSLDLDLEGIVLKYIPTHFTFTLTIYEAT